MNQRFSRRTFLKQSALAAACVSTGSFLCVAESADNKAHVRLQIGFIASGNQIGEVAAKRLGYYEQENIDFEIIPAGPNIDGVANVATRQAEIGQISSSPSVMLAVSQGIPIKAFATGLQQHPYCFFSLKRKPVRTPHDMIGKRIGIQSTGVVLLKALLAKNSIAESQVEIVPIGTDFLPLLSGQVDAATGWQTNVSALSVLGADRVDLRLWDTGVRLYALPYYAHVSTIQSNPDILRRFLRATSKGWMYANNNRDAAIDLLIKEYPNLKRSDERAAVDVLMRYAFDDTTKKSGWGAMETSVWQEQIATYATLNQFTGRVPSVDDVATLDVLKATESSRREV